MLAIALSPEIPVPPILPASETIDSSSLTAAVGSVSSTESITHSPESFAVEFSNSANGAIAPSEWLVAQNVRPAGDGVGTTVGQVGDQFNIQDGRRSGNNLFHSFEAFGLDADQTANFISEVGIENILGRVTGGDPSVINGIIRVFEGNSNLYLINPAGILFGADASLNLAGSFTATTANGISFDEGWFSATGENNFASLIGEPERFAFTTSEPGAIVNSGNLSVLAGNSLSLIGGTVISTGTLTAPGGDTAAIEPRGVMIATVPGGNLVRISQEGSLLSLDVQPLGSDRPNALPFTPASLPDLLTGGEIDHATDLIVNPDGSVQLTTGRTVESGDIVASRLSTATSDSVNSGNAVAESGDVLLWSTNAIAAGTIDTSAEANDRNATASAGDIRLLANVDITVGTFDTSALAQASGSALVTGTATGGDVQLESRMNGSHIRFSRINTGAEARSSSTSANVDGTGGNVEIFANGTVRGTGTGNTINTQSTITEGQVTSIADGGSVTIQHDGGADNVPFIVGDASENGTAGAINTGEVTLTNETFAIVGTETRGARNEVSVTLANTAPRLPQASQIPQIELGQPISFTLAELNLIASDANADSTTIQIVAIASGRLTRNGVVLRPGDTVSPNDVLVYTPPAETLGDLDAFSVRASDRLSVSTPVAVNFNVVEPIPPSVTDPSPPRTDLPTPPDAFPVEQLPLNLQVSTDRLLGEPLAQSPQLTPLIVLDVVWPEPLLLLLPPRQFLQGIPLDGTSGEDTAGGQSGTLTDFTAGSRPTFGTPDNPDDTNPGPLTEPDADIVEDSTPPNPDDSGEPIEPDSSNPDSSPTFEPPADETVAVAPTDEEPSTAAPSVDGDLVNSSPNLNSDRVVTSPDRSIEQRIQNCQAQAERIQATGAADRSEGLYALLINCYEQNLAIAQAAENFEWQAYSLNNLAISHFVIGNYQQAIDYHQQQLQLAQEAGDQTQVGIALSGIGAAYGALGDYPTAIDYYTQGLEKISVTVAPQWRSLTLRNLGNAYLMQKDYEQAIDYQNASLILSQSVGDRYGEMQTLGNLGNAYTGTREFDRAITYHQQSIALARELTNRLQEAQALLNLGTTHSYRHDYIQAVTHHEQSLIIMRELRARLGEGIALTNLGDALFNLDRLPEAEQALFAGIEVWESLRAGLGNNDALKVSIFETQSATYRNLQEVLADQDKAAIALEVSERGRARAFVELIARDAAGVDQEQFAVEPPNLSQLRQTAIDQNATLVEYSIIREQAVDTPHGASEQSLNEPQESELFIWVIAPTGEVTFRRVDLRSLPSLSNASLAELANVARQGIRGEGVAHDSSTNESRTGDNAVLTPGDLVRRLGEPSSWQPYQVTAVDLDAGTVTLSHPEITLPAPVALAEVYPVESQRSQVRRSQYRRLQQLHQILIEPIADLLPNDPNERVIFVPQEYLFLVPFAALQAPDGQYLIEHHTLLTTSAVQVLELSQQRPANAAQTAIVVGNPAPMPGSLAPLPYAEAEAEAIAQLLNTTAITGTDATETAIRQRLSDAQIIHFATHGLFNETHPLQGAIALAPSTAEEDGFLTAAEILDLSLNAELVVLSACNTGRGKITGDGVVGLSRSLIAAGAPSVMVSLWQVPDDATSQLMVDFYRHRQQFDDAQALRQSMLSAMQTYPNPRDWAAFTLVGSTPQR
ncbi:CHAT domain-containing protein [Leptolyngbya sp. FACHB-671]|uniref:CHAT domain-containing protein n=1 Tax=Leptolyngbya sp. FACHB-671 TaxID=2692812 RepID=UPI001686AC93|nr:CHAT domain-containing protein [Leptolyngbya sp. FACHB-671]MBD2069460.1 CHAT domain-containing protein [Leptolyngbya sp. FACHB-671]